MQLLEAINSDLQTALPVPATWSSLFGHGPRAQNWVLKPRHFEAVVVSPRSLALRAWRVCLKLGSQSMMISQWMEWGTGYPIFKQTDVGETCLKMLGNPQNPCGLSSVFRSRLHLWGWSKPLLFWLNPWCTPYFLFLTRSFAATTREI